MHVVAVAIVLAICAALLLAAGSVFIIEMLQRLFSQDYRALAQAAATSPPITLFGRPWVPVALSTWLPPIVVLAGGVLLALAARRRLAVPA
jgi:branched-chain amino acid transport system permease protein